MAEALLRLTENTSLRGVQREDQEPVGTKRKQLDEMEFAEREIKLRSMRVDTVRNFSEVMSMLDEDWKQDSRLVQQTKDWCKNGLLTKQLLLTDGEPAYISLCVCERQAWIRRLLRPVCDLYAARCCAVFACKRSRAP